jgi:AraC family transcriptional regulator of arabinose operon
MPLFVNVIDSMQVKLLRSGYRSVVTPAYFDGAIMQMNYVIHLLKGKMYIGKEETEVEVGSLVFVPAGKPMYVKYGNKTEFAWVGRDVVEEQPEKVTLYLAPADTREDAMQNIGAISFVGLDVLLYNAVSLFSMLDIEKLIIPLDDDMKYLVHQVCLESGKDNLGKEQLINSYINVLVILLCRHLNSNSSLKDGFDRLKYLSDKRLIDIIRYIQDNLSADLSNKAIAGVAYVSEDYVGQFFKTLIGINLQDYIENQRLEFAYKMLRSKAETIQEVAHQVGFKDPAYFSRRFKMKFGINANQARGDKNYLV